MAETWNDISWQYIIRPTVLHSQWKKEAKQGDLTSKFADIEPNPAQVTAAATTTTVSLTFNKTFVI